MVADKRILSDEALDTVFREARTHSAWLKKDVSDVRIEALYDLMKFGPTSANCSPARFLFLKSKDSKELLKSFLAPGNIEKTMSAPVTVIIAYDNKFYDNLPKLFPQTDAKSWFTGDPKNAAETAFRNGSLQGAYLMLAARALGLDCGPMSGFNREGVRKTFFPDQENVEVNFLCNLGYGDTEKLHPRNPRLSFDEACKII